MTRYDSDATVKADFDEAKLLHINEAINNDVSGELGLTTERHVLERTAEGRRDSLAARDPSADSFGQ